MKRTPGRTSACSGLIRVVFLTSTECEDLRLASQNSRIYPNAACQNVINKDPLCCLQGSSSHSTTAAAESGSLARLSPWRVPPMLSLLSTTHTESIFTIDSTILSFEELPACLPACCVNKNLDQIMSALLHTQATHTHTP